MTNIIPITENEIVEARQILGEIAEKMSDDEIQNDNHRNEIFK